MIGRPPRSPLFPYPPLFRSQTTATTRVSSETPHSGNARRASWASPKATPACDIRPSQPFRARAGVTSGWRPAHSRPYRKLITRNPIRSSAQGHSSASTPSCSPAPQRGEHSDRQVERPGARQRLGGHEHEREQDRGAQVLRDRHTEQVAGERPARLQLADHRAGDGGRPGGGECAEHERDGEPVVPWLMRRDGQPRAHRPGDERHYYKGEGDRAGREPPERRAAGAQQLKRQLRPGGEREEADGDVRDELQGRHLVRPNEAEPRGPRRKPDQQIAGHARQAHAPREVATHESHEQQEPERQGRPRFERPARGDAMKQRHHQNQREQARDPAHGPQRYSRRRDFDNACERRYFQRVPLPPKNWIEAVRFGDDGLVPVVAQSALAGEVLMVAYADREALQKTRDTGQAHYRSRSRGELWQKGATSGHTQAVQEVRVDCDGDAVLYLVRQQGPACHTGAPTCFGEPTGGTLIRPAPTVAERARDQPAGAYTGPLLDAGGAQIAP